MSPPPFNDTPPLGDVLVSLIPSCLASFLALGCLWTSVNRSLRSDKSKPFRERPLEEKLHLAAHVLLVAYNVAVSREAFRIIAEVSQTQRIVIYAFNSLLFLVSFFVRFLSIRRFFDVLSATLGLNRRWNTGVVIFTTAVFAIAFAGTLILLVTRPDGWEEIVDLISAMWGFVLAVIITGVVGAVTKVVMKVKTKLFGATKSGVVSQDRLDASQDWLTMQKYSLFLVFGSCIIIVIFCTVMETVGTTSLTFPRTGVIQFAIQLYVVILLYVEHVIKDLARWDMHGTAPGGFQPKTLLQSSRSKKSTRSNTPVNDSPPDGKRSFFESIRPSSASRTTKAQAVDAGPSNKPRPPASNAFTA
ncbi:uncharacterized protein EV422DRAFT_532013 [Fimicolochytrium jonesii]|uniref:uncharacterized protein n=1 Tax=Fimicolochytrium jonesii TaxID=1396493 RepID=UPI0022FF1FA9|nr:uncharacterized protein EV422DRAFT_532013 [Fimicolochytrium jonesii]KAI8820205.1 hypothetical protein EV422DRAFT_532013 [Fimicolochytrium jonesii]